MGDRVKKALGEGYENLSWNDIEDLAERSLAEAERYRGFIERCIESGYPGRNAAEYFLDTRGA